MVRAFLLDVGAARAADAPGAKVSAKMARVPLNLFMPAVVLDVSLLRRPGHVPTPSLQFFGVTASRAPPKIFILGQWERFTCNR